MPKVISLRRVQQLQRRKHITALVRYFYTGEWTIPHSPVLPSARLSWPATTSRNLIVAK